MIFVVFKFIDHFTLKLTRSVNRVWIITFIRYLHVWLTNPQPSLIFLKLPVLTSFYVVWVNSSDILFDETQHVVKKFTAGYVPVCYEVINLFIKP